MTKEELRVIESGDYLLKMGNSSRDTFGGMVCLGIQLGPGRTVREPYDNLRMQQR